MSKKPFERRRDSDDYEDGGRKKKLSQVREDKDRKKNRNYDNAIRSKNIDRLLDFDDE